MRVSKLSAAKSTARVIVKKPGRLDAEHNCLSCHDPHASEAEHLLRPAAKARGTAENLPFGYSGNFMVINGISQNVPELQGLFPGGQL